MRSLEHTHPIGGALDRQWFINTVVTLLADHQVIWGKREFASLLEQYHRECSCTIANVS
jgi:hypothetical protein